MLCSNYDEQTMFNKGTSHIPGVVSGSNCDETKYRQTPSRLQDAHSKDR